MRARSSAGRAGRTRSLAASAALTVACSLLLSGCFLRSIVGFVGDDGAATLSGNLEVGFCNFTTGIDQFYGCTYTIRDDSGFLIEITSTFELISEGGIFGAIIDPLVLQVPSDATNVVATYNNAGSDDPLVVTETTSFPVTPGVTVDAEVGTKFLILELPDAAAAALPAGLSDIDVGLEFDVVDFANLFVKTMLTARVVESATTYYVPVFPCVTDFAQIPAIQIPVHGTFQDLRPGIRDAFAGSPEMACDQMVYDFTAGAPATSTTTTVAPTTVPPTTVPPTTVAPTTIAATTTTLDASAGTLPVTGSNSVQSLVALVLVAAGGGLVLLATRRRPAK